MAGRKLGDPVQLHPDRLEAPLHWRKPRRVFVNSLSDLFHEDVPNKFIAAIFGVMAACPQHAFQVLTKRPERMLSWFQWVQSHRPAVTRELIKQGGAWPKIDEYSAESLLCVFSAREVLEPLSRVVLTAWPLPNVWLGVSVEDQQTADERIPILLQTPTAVRFVSVEPLLGPVDLREVNPIDDFYIDALDTPDQSFKLNWVIVGGESGPKARPCDVAWIRSIVRQCEKAAVPCFVKQLGARPYEDGCAPGHVWIGKSPASLHQLSDKKGGDPTEWPEDLRVREFPGQ